MLVNERGGLASEAVAVDEIVAEAIGIVSSGLAWCGHLKGAS
jgi:hypothetical protein